VSKLHVRRKGRADQRAMTHRGLCRQAVGREILGGMKWLCSLQLRLEKGRGLGLLAVAADADADADAANQQLSPGMFPVLEHIAAACAPVGT
jgi:hypothetical protein